MRLLEAGHKHNRSRQCSRAVGDCFRNTRCSMESILIVDDDQAVREMLFEVVRNMGKHAIAASNGREGLERFQEHSVDLVIVDLKMPGMAGEELLREIKRLDRDAVVIVLTGYPSVDTAVETIQAGAYDYLMKPAPAPEIKMVIERALERRRLAKKLGFFTWLLIISVPICVVLGVLLVFMLR